MAIPLSTYGNTLTDLQSGTNAAQGLDYQRANAQDAINQQRLEAFLKLRGQQAQIQAQQNALAQDRAMQMAQLIQQDKQFNTTAANTMTLADKDAASRLAVANAAAKGMDPRAFETILAYNQQGQDKVAQARALSAQRKSTLAEIKAEKDKHWYGNGAGAAQFKNTFGREPDASSAASRLNALDTQAASLGLEPDNEIDSPSFGGYKLPTFNPITTGGSRGTPAINPPVLPFNPTGPAQPPPVPPQTQVPATFLPGSGAISIGGVPSGVPSGGEFNFGGSNQFDGGAPAMFAPPPPAPATKTIRIGADGKAYYVQ